MKVNNCSTKLYFLKNYYIPEIFPESFVHCLYICSLMVSFAHMQYLGKVGEKLQRALHTSFFFFFLFNCRQNFKHRKFCFLDSCTQKPMHCFLFLTQVCPKGHLLQSRLFLPPSSWWRPGLTFTHMPFNGELSFLICTHFSFLIAILKTPPGYGQRKSKKKWNSAHFWFLLVIVFF